VIRGVMRDLGMEPDELQDRVLFYFTLIGGAFAFFALGVALRLSELK